MGKRKNKKCNTKGKDISINKIDDVIDINKNESDKDLLNADDTNPNKFVQSPDRKEKYQADQVMNMNPLHVNTLINTSGGLGVLIDINEYNVLHALKTENIELRVNMLKSPNKKMNSKK